MSGRKCSKVRISQSQYDSLVARARRADDASALAKVSADREQAKFREFRRDVERQQQKMRNEHKSSLERLTSTIRDLETRHVEGLEDLRFDVNRSLEDQRREFREALDRQRRETRAALNEIRTEIAADKRAQERHASSQIQDMETLLGLMRKDGAHARFAPGALEELEAKLSLARENYDAQQYQAALASSQERYFEYQRLQQTVAERQAEWRAYLEELERRTADLTGKINATRGAVYSFENDDAETPAEVPADVDFWSKGRFARIARRVDEASSRLERPESYSTEELKAFIEEIAGLDGLLGETIDKAKEALVQSQIRQNLAESILETFDDTQWELEDSTYEKQDYRETVHFKLSNELGEDIVVSVHPVESEEGLSSEVEVNFFDNSNDERLRAARLQAIHSGLRGEEFSADRFRCLDGSENQPGLQRMRDFERLKRKEATPDGRAT